MEEKGNIFIVDDNAGLCRILSFVLRRKGYAVTTANDGAEAFEKAKETPFDIIFMDIKMPLMNGVETYRRVKKIRPEAVVIMMTAYGVEDLVQEALDEGAFAIMYKPLDIEKVISLIEEAKEVGKGMLVLVVDEDRGVYTTLKNVLAKKGFGVCCAPTGEEAISMTKEKAWDIVFIDIKLPTINGLETFLALKETNPEIVAIMMTSHRKGVTDLVKEALKNNAYAYLDKPLNIEVTLKVIDEILEKKQKKNE